jgi:hypothetical protein
VQVGSTVTVYVREVPAGIGPAVGVAAVIVAVVLVPVTPLTIRSRAFAALDIVTIAVPVPPPAATMLPAFAQSGDTPVGTTVAVGGV